MATLIPPISDPDAVFKLIVPEVVIAESELSPVKPVPGVIDVTVPELLVNPLTVCVLVPANVMCPWSSNVKCGMVIVLPLVAVLLQIAAPSTELLWLNSVPFNVNPDPAEYLVSVAPIVILPELSPDTDTFEPGLIF